MRTRVLYRVLLPTVLPLIMAACGGGDSRHAGATLDTPAEGTVPTLVETPAFGAREAAPPLLPPDTDADGIPDHLDIAPQTPLRVPGVEQPPLAVDAAYTQRAGGRLDNLAVIGEPLVLETAGAQWYGGPWLLLWHHPGGVFAQPVQPDSRGRVVTETPELLAASVTLVAGEYRSLPWRMRTVAANAPVLVLPDTPLQAGRTVMFSGQQVQRITRIMLGGQRLTFSVLSNELLSLTLPARPEATLLQWRDDQGNRYQGELPLLRQVTVRADPSLASADWRGAVADTVITAAAPQTLWVPAGAPQTLLMAHPSRSLTARAVLWPDQDEVTFGAASTLMQWLWQQQAQGAVQHWPSVRTRLETLVGQHPALLADLALALSGDDAALARAQSAYSQRVAEMAMTHPQDTPDAPQPLVQSRSWAGDVLDAIMAGGSLYEPTVDVINHRARPGSATFGRLTVGIPSTCIGIENITAPNNLWPADFCLRNGAAFVLSARVVDARSGQALSQHIRDALDPGLIGGHGFGLLSIPSVAYLVDSAGVPLCRMKPCNIEVLTGAFGMGTHSAMTPEEERLATSLLARTLLERVVLEMISDLSGMAIAGNVSSCITRNLIGRQAGQVPGYLLTVTDFRNKVAVAGSEDEVWNILTETVVKYVLDVLRGSAADFRIERCLDSLSGDTKTLFRSNVGAAIGQAASSAAVPLRVAQVVKRVYDGWEIITMPRKIVFNAVPRAALTSVSTPLDGDLIDANRPDIHLRLYGNTIAREGDDAFFPTLVITDGRATVSLPLNHSHKGNPQQWPWYELRVPATELIPLMQPLRSGRITVGLEARHETFEGFPNGRLPIPGLPMQWRSAARALGYDSGTVRGGSTVRLIGENLGTFNRPDLRVELVPATGGASVNGVRPQYQSESWLSFDLPLLILPGDYEVRVSSPVHDAMSVPALLRVLAADSSSLVLADDGENSDDQIVISLMDEQYNFVSLFGSTASAGIPTPHGRYAVELWWRDNLLSAPATRLDVLCVDPGADNVCTYRIKGEIYHNGQFFDFDVRGKLEDEGSVAYPLF